MKKRLVKMFKIGGLFLLILSVVLLTVVWVSERDRAVVEKYVKNENLETVKPDWQGTPVDQEGRFVNAEFPFLPRVSELLRWQLSANPFKEEKRADDWRIEVKDPTEFLSGEQNGILWLGHAGFFIRLEGVEIVVDPALGNPSFIRIQTEVPSPLDKIKNVDYLLVTHDHRDHCDDESISQIARKFPNARLLGGLGMEDLFNEWKTPSNQVQTAGWYQQFSTPDETKVKIFFLPVRHWSRRGLFDTNQRLWGAFVIQGAGRTIYIGGDSGFGSHYREAGEVFPEIDYFIIGIGAYEPRWFMKPNHNSPQDAFQAFVDSRAKYLVPMHYGRFDLSDEPPGEPLRSIKTEAEKAGASARLRVLQIYESLNF